MKSSVNGIIGIGKWQMAHGAPGLGSLGLIMLGLGSTALVCCMPMYNR